MKVLKFEISLVDETENVTTRLACVRRLVKVTDKYFHEDWATAKEKILECFEAMKIAS